MNSLPLTFENLAVRIAAAGGLFVGLDRDGTLIEDCGYGVMPEDVSLKPGIKELYVSLCGLGHPFETAIFTNQSAVGRGLTSYDTVEKVNQQVARTVNLAVGAEWLVEKRFFVCPHDPSFGCQCRKPNSLMYELASKALSTTQWPFIMIGDRSADVVFAEHCHGVSIQIVADSETIEAFEQSSIGHERGSAYMAPSLNQAAQIIEKAGASIPSSRSELWRRVV